jgi:site-specific recombinase XerD
MNRINKINLKVVPVGDEFQTYVDRWLTACKANGLSPKSINTYDSQLAHFTWWFTEYSTYAKTLGSHPEVVTLEMLREYVAYLRGDQAGGRWGLKAAETGKSWTGASKVGLNPSTIQNYAATARTFFAWLEQESYIEKTPFTRALKINPTNKQKTRVVKNVAEDDIVKIFEALTSPDRLATYEGTRNFAMVSFLLDTGVRRGELLSIKMEDLDKERRRCKVRGKTGERFVFYSATTERALRDYLTRYRDRQSEDSSLELWLTKIDDSPVSDNTLGSMIFDLSRASGVKFHAHSLRHSFATIMANGGMNVFNLKELLGHSSINTTQIYVSSSADMLQTAYRGSAPLDKLEVGKRSRRGRPRRT